MHRNVSVLHIFVASPSDVQEERNALESVIKEVNQNLAKSLGLRLELVKWETDVTPAFGSDAQDVINKQIGDNYDIFIGILWSRAGTPTPRSESGTLEEFERAYRRHLKNSASIDLLVYFKETPVSPSKIDPDQLVKIRNFRNSLGEKGGLYWTFDSLSDFETILRTHLSSVTRKWKEKIDNPTLLHEIPSKLESEDEGGKKAEIVELSPDLAKAIAEIENEDDYGFIDYIDIYNSRFADINNVLIAFAKATENIGTKLSKQTQAIKLANEMADKTRAFSIIKKSFKTISNDIDNYSKTLDKNNEILSDARKEAFGALSKSLVLFGDSYPDEMQAIEQLETQLRMLLEPTETAFQQMSEFRNTFAQLPKFSIQFNKSRRKVLASLDRLLEELTVFEEGTTNLLDAIDDLKNN